ncbi:MAG: S8 family serine peptidase [Promethearchaeia archaeon]
MVSFEVRKNRIFAGLLLLNLMLSYSLFWNTGSPAQGQKKEIINTSNISRNNLTNGSTESILNRLDSRLLSDIQDQNETKELHLLFEVEKGYLKDSTELFQQYGKVEDLLDYKYYCGFSALINISQFNVYLSRKPEYIKYIKYNEKPEPALHNTLQQLRVNPYLREQYGLKGDKQSTIAILDSGIDTSHPAFRNKNITWVDYIDSTEKPFDTRGHGTGVAGVASAEPYKTVDEENRTIITENEYFDWRGYSFNNISANYKFITNGFIASSNGTIEVQGNWFASDSSTIKEIYAFDLVNSTGDPVQSVNVTEKDKNYNLTYQVNQSNYGVYSIQHRFNLTSTDDPTYGINLTVHLPENQSQIEQYYQGLAPDSKLVVYRCVEEGKSSESDILAAMNDIMANKTKYNITTAIMSFKIENSDKVRSHADQMVKEGIFVAAAAGNEGPFDKDGQPKNWAGSLENAPGCADKVMSVGATTYNYSLTEYSSRGGYSPTGNVIKPDIVAFGGSKYLKNHPAIYVPDSNDGEYLGDPDYVPDTYENMEDVFKNDSNPASGTSYAAPIVGGAAQLLIEQLGGVKNWNYTEQNALFIKNLLLLTATETFPNKRLINASQSPSLDRGEKDRQEGYGKINIDAAIDALDTSLEVNSSTSGGLYSIPTKEIKKPYSWARMIDLPRAYYNISLEVPENTDFDLYVYDYQGDQFGEPIIKAKSVNDTLGVDEELIDFPAHTAGKYFIAVKGVNGSGQFNLSIYTSPTYYDTIDPECQLDLPLENRLHNESIFIKGNGSDNHNLQKVSIIISSPTRTETIPILFENTTESNFNATWNSKKIDNGECTIYAILYDDFNNTVISNMINITIFNDDIPPAIVFISPKDGASYIENTNITIQAELSDIHHEIANATLFIETEKRIIQKFYSNITDTIYFIWNPSLGESGNCFLYIEAYDTKNNLARSETVFIFIQRSYLLRNTLIFFAIISIGLVAVLNKYAKKLLMNEEIMAYLEDLSDFIRRPRKVKLKKIDPKQMFHKISNDIETQLDNVNEFILEKKHKKAYVLAGYILQHLADYKAEERVKEEIRLVLEDIRSDLGERIRTK